MNPPDRYDLPRIVLAVLSILALLLASLWVLFPFLGAGIWAAMVVIATWPLMIRLQARLGGRRGLAVAVLLLGLLLVLILPLCLAVATLATQADEIAGWGGRIVDGPLPQPPSWLASIPVAGPQLVELWLTVIDGDILQWRPQLAAAGKAVASWLVAHAGGAGMALLQFLLMLVIAAVMYMRGEIAAAGVIAFFRRLAGDNGEAVVVLAGQAIRSVAIGLVVTAVIQSMLGGIGVWVAGIPLAGLLAAIMFMTTLAQIGPLVVLIPATIWLYWSGQSGWGTALLVWSVFVGSVDNVIRPWLIQRGADLPFLLVFIGVLGGLISFGMLGLFIGPVLLAVAWTLLDTWVYGHDKPAKADAPTLPDVARDTAEETGAK
ncbi:AI-2E family transporter YdiK [Uliginosibacterium sp. H1]|uniref:AI-2E family transporter YdiK n=1 Tax=Uliginosibacterium sp. H1 TaxID=3114757 RepID=UPI002E19A629|nr:AI-2E family transporter YdiK [Uliginosibacterium sp. H1]